jgi:CTD small phosphatase-like protein 2
LVDNAAYSYAFQLDNGVPIIPYFKGKNDFELKALENYLLSFLNK